jgi:predicted GTPase
VLAELMRRSARASEVNKVLQNAIALEPYNYLYFRSLALHYVTQSDFQSGLHIIEPGLQLFPEDSYLRNLQRRARMIGSASY